MLKKSYPFGVAILMLITGCDFFSTREILPKPSDIRSFQGFDHPGDSVVFRVIESIGKTGSKAEQKVLSRRHMVFTVVGDSVIGDVTYKLVDMKMTEEPSGYLVEQSRRLLDFSGPGLTLIGTPGGAGARFYPFKAAGTGDTSSYLALPMVFTEGWSLRQSMGVLSLNRELADANDTVPYLAHSEATWKIVESVSDRGIDLVTGEYWYGRSGLLKAEQVWPDFEQREANAARTNTGDFHRNLERL